MTNTTFSISNQLQSTSLFLMPGETLEHGEWQADFGPPAVIEPGSMATCVCESDGFLTGDEGTLRYYPARSEGEVNWEAPGDELLSFFFDDPFDGGNSFSASAPPSSPYTVLAQEISGTGAGYDPDDQQLTFQVLGRYGPTTCVPGYVWREAFPGDHVCVLPSVRQQAANDNREAAERAGSDGQCKSGYVWREARGRDHVCVTPETRQQAEDDDAARASRTL
jgi:hypothetical protein